MRPYWAQPTSSASLQTWFQSMRPRSLLRGATSLAIPGGIGAIFQSMRPRSLLRGATSPLVFFTGLIHVSIHAPVRGATYHTATFARVVSFQSMRPYGAQQKVTARTARVRCFNPCARVVYYGAQRRVRDDHTTASMFQSMRPYGARPRSWARSWSCFNPCARVVYYGAQPHLPEPRNLLHVSIHAPA